MAYSLDWDPAAEDELARIWLAAPDRNAVSAVQLRGRLAEEQPPRPMHRGAAGPETFDVDRDGQVH